MKYLSSFLLFFLISLPSFGLEYGIDRLGNPEVAEILRGKNLAVLTHAAARNKNQEHLIDLLFKSFSLKKIFAPEHGLRTLADDWVGDGTDEQTGLSVISLYKREGRAPNPQDLIGIDAIVIDLQDVGVRYYTYFSTIAEVMKACANLNVEIIILDRPNLLGGIIMEGKLLDQTLAGKFTAYHTIPTRHGMTLGELALMLKAEKNIKTKLTVITATGWQREALINNLDRSWIAPSPALIEIDQVGLYALWGSLENFNLAVGRGLENNLAFRVLGAPWMTTSESQELAHELNALGFSGATFTPFNWIVTRAQYEGEKVNGIRLEWNGSETRTDEFTYKVASLLVKKFKNRINSSSMPAHIFGSTSMTEAIRNGVSWKTYKKIIDLELTQFKIRRAPYLLYSQI